MTKVKWDQKGKTLITQGQFPYKKKRNISALLPLSLGHVNTRPGSNPSPGTELAGALDLTSSL